MKSKGTLFRYSSLLAGFFGIAYFAGILFSCTSPLQAQPSRPGAVQAAAGWKAYEEGRLQDAKALLEQAVEISPTVADYQAALAEVDSKLGQDDAAIRHFNKAIALKPLDTEFRLDLAQLLQRKGNDQAALHTLQMAHPTPELADLWHFTRGFSLFRLGNFGPAKDEFNAVAMKPQFMASASFFLGNIAYMQSRFDEAEPYLAKAVELGNVEGNKAYNVYAYDYGLVLFKLGKYAEADRQFRASIARFDRDPLPWMFLGRCEAQLGNYPEAIAMLETSIKTDSTFQLSYYELARLQQRHGDPNRAAELFAKIGELKKEEVNKEEERATRLKAAPAPR
jgi:tetratricopeptide (TPR) repeat protein